MEQITEENQEKKKLLSLMLDAVFKLYFANKENEEQLRLFLKAVTGLTDEDLAVIEIKNPILTKQHVQEKDFIVDIRITTATGQFLNMEMQMRGHDAFKERIVAGNARQFSSQLNRGEDYRELKAAITLVVTNFQMFDDSDDVCEYITFCRKNGKVFTDAQQFYIMDLTKLPKQLKGTTHAWGALFKAKTEKELRALMEQSEDMKKAGEKLLKLSADEEAREIARAREYSQWAWNYTLHATQRRAHEEGIEQGIVQSIINMMDNLKLPLEDALAAVGMPESERESYAIMIKEKRQQIGLL